MKSMRWVLTLIALLAAGWFGWHYLQFRSCSERTCQAPSGEPPIVLASGKELPVLSTHLDDGRHLVIDYLTEHPRTDRGALCREAEEVWQSVKQEMNTRRVERVVLGPTSPDGEFLGMKYLVVPLYTCCVSTHLRVQKDASGKWVFPDCAS